VELIGVGGHVRIFSSDGHIGLPYSWSSHMTRKSTSLTMKKDQQAAVAKMPLDRCSPSVTLVPLPEIPKDKKLLLPTRVIMYQAGPPAPGRVHRTGQGANQVDE